MVRNAMVHVVGFPSFLRLNIISLNGYSTFCVFVRRWAFGLRPPLGCCDERSWERGVRMFLWDPASILVAVNPETGVPNLFSISEEPPYCFPLQTGRMAFPNPADGAHGPGVSTSSPALAVSSVCAHMHHDSDRDSDHPNGCEVVAHGGFDSHSGVAQLFICSLAFCVSSLETCVFKSHACVSVGFFVFFGAE